MEKQIFKHALSILWNEVNKSDLGYEMGCLISSEFTPAPSYSGVKSKLLKFFRTTPFTLSDFEAFLIWANKKWKHPFKEAPYWEAHHILLSSYKDWDDEYLEDIDPAGGHGLYSHI